MDIPIGQARLHASIHGDGPVLLVLHGAGVDHREPEASLEPLLDDLGLRRVYLDLPAMGSSTADGLDSVDGVVGAIAGFIAQLDAGPVRLLGHSFGAYLARGVAARHRDAVAGLALLRPVGDGTAAVPPPSVVVDEPDARDELAPELHQGFDDYFVVRTRATARRYRDAVTPGIATVDQDAFGRIVEHWAIDLGDGSPFDGPSLIVAGRQDATAGFEHAVSLLDAYPRATLAVLDGAGHALPHERPEVLGALLRDWLSR